MRSVLFPQAAAYISGVWALSAAICLPPLLGWGNEMHFSYDMGTRVHYCTLFQAPSYVIFSACGSFFIPFFITSFLYLRIFAVLRQRVQKMRCATSPAYRANKYRHSGARQPANSSQQFVTSNAANHHQFKTAIYHHHHPNNRVGQLPTVVTEHVDTTDAPDNDDSHSEDNELNQSTVKDEDGASGMEPDDSPRTINVSCAHNAIIRMSRRRQHNHVEYIAVQVADHDEDSARADETTVTITTAGAQTPTTPKGPMRSVSAEQRKTSFKKPKADKETESSGRQSRIESLRHRIRRMSSTLRRRTFSRFSNLQKSRQEQRETRATLRMAVIIAFFCGMWLGFFVTYVVRGVCGSACRLPRQLEATFFWLGYANSCINPVLYAIFNDDFRKAFRNILGCNRRRKGRHVRQFCQRRL